MAENATLEQSITTAMEAEGATPPLEQTIEATPPGTKGAAAEGEEPKEEKKEEPKLNVNGLTELEQQQANQLFAALKDPAAAEVIVAEMARRAGYTKETPKAEVKEIKKDITAVLKEQLGPDLDYLAEKLGPVFEKAMNEKIEEKTAEIHSKFAEQERAKLAAEANQAMSEIAKSQFNKDEIPEDVLADMNKLMDKVDPKNMSTKEYIEFIYYSVAGRRGLKAVDPATSDRVKKNRTDAPARLASEGGGSPNAVSLPAKAMSLTDSIKAAIEAAEKG